VADLLDEANRKLREVQNGRHLAIGPSHFMRKDLSEDSVARIWKYAVMPQLEETFFGEEERLKEFSLDALKQAIASAGVSVEMEPEATSAPPADRA
jgi:5-methylcytosine-specific restriction enzyme B